LKRIHSQDWDDDEDIPSFKRSTAAPNKRSRNSEELFDDNESMTTKFGKQSIQVKNNTSYNDENSNVMNSGLNSRYSPKIIDDLDQEDTTISNQNSH
jgi:hypothetical protein